MDMNRQIDGYIDVYIDGQIQMEIQIYIQKDLIKYLYLLQYMITAMVAKDRTPMTKATSMNSFTSVSFTPIKHSNSQTLKVESQII